MNAGNTYKETHLHNKYNDDVKFLTFLSNLETSLILQSVSIAAINPFFIAAMLRTGKEPGKATSKGLIHELGLAIGLPDRPWGTGEGENSFWGVEREMWASRPITHWYFWEDLDDIFIKERIMVESLNNCYSGGRDWGTRRLGKVGFRNFTSFVVRSFCGGAD